MASEYLQIAQMPTCYENIHESVMRSYHIVKKVKYLLGKGTDPEIVLGMIDLMETTEPKGANQ